MQVNVAVRSEFDIIACGVREVLERFPERVRVVDPDGDGGTVDVLLWSGFGTPRSPDFAALRGEHCARRVVVLCWDLEPGLVDKAIAGGADGYLTTRLTAADLVDALERVHLGERVVSPTPVQGVREDAVAPWPGNLEGLSEREADIVALIAQGMSNDDIASSLFISINTVKSYIRGAYRKMGVSSRAQAVLWAVDHGFRHRRAHADLA